MNTQEQIKISAVSYANTYPFLYGINQKLNDAQISLSLDVPSECARKLQQGTVDLGLIPVAEMRNIPNARIVSDYCIGAVGRVKTVLLMSTMPLDEITDVYLDSESRSSVNLVKVLAKHHWKKDWQWHPAPADFPNAEEHPSIVLIGDKTYGHRAKYPYIYDLSEHWTAFSGKPFVFAAWVANKQLPESFLQEFNSALSHGLQNIDAALNVYAQASVRDELRDYLNNYISYRLDDQKREGMQLFLSFLD
jgi:chorismate dehydratase